MRYRVKDYTISTSSETVTIQFYAPQGVTLTSDPDSEIEGYIFQAIRLIINESKNTIICSSLGKKWGNWHRIKVNPNTRLVTLTFFKNSYEDVQSWSTSDVYTIEMDWGDVGTDLAKASAVSDIRNTELEFQFFAHAISSNGMVKAVTIYQSGSTLEWYALTRGMEIYIPNKGNFCIARIYAQEGYLISEAVDGYLAIQMEGTPGGYTWGVGSDVYSYNPASNTISDSTVGTVHTVSSVHIALSSDINSAKTAILGSDSTATNTSLKSLLTEINGKLDQLIPVQ